MFYNVHYIHWSVYIYSMYVTCKYTYLGLFLRLPADGVHRECRDH